MPRRAGVDLTRKQVRGPGWRRSSRGFYVPVDTPRTPEQRVAEASMVLPPGGAITGWAALRWMGGRWFEGTSEGGRVETAVPICVTGRAVRAQAGISVSEERLDPREVVEHDGLSLTTAHRSLDFEMRHAVTLVEAVVAADMTFFSDLVSLEEHRHYVADHRGRRGAQQARRALELAHENSWSPMETRLRMVWRLVAGLPAPLVNAPVFDLRGNHLGTPDLLDLEAGLVVEYDGAEHLARKQRAVDLGREDRLRDVGLAYLTVLGDQMRDESRLADRLIRARVRALAERTSPQWTAQPPPSWTMLDTVVRRRAHRARAIWPMDEPLPFP